MAEKNEKHGTERNLIQLVSGEWVRIHRVNPLSSGMKDKKVKLLALEKGFSGEHALRVKAKVENHERLIRRTDGQIIYLQDALEDKNVSAGEKEEIRKKLADAQRDQSEMEKAVLALQEQLADDVRLIKEAQFDLASWALQEQHGYKEEQAVRELDAQAEIQICACLLGVDPRDAYPEPKRDQDAKSGQNKEDEADQHPLSEKQKKKGSS